MAKQDLEKKTVRELRTMAKRAGIAVKGDWRKADLVKVLSLKKKPAAKPLKPAKKTQPVKPPNLVKPAKKPQTSKSKSVSMKVLPKKAPKPDFVSVAVKPPPEVVLTPLPSEYSGDKIVSMQVNPGRIYVYWEVAEDRLAKYKGSLNLKVVDTKGNCFFYTPVSGRIGESFLNINPDSDYSVEIGIIDSKGEFVNIMQPGSTAVTKVHSEIPACGKPEMTGTEQKKEEVALPEEFFEVPDPVGSL